VNFVNERPEFFFAMPHAGVVLGCLGGVGELEEATSSDGGVQPFLGRPLTSETVQGSVGALRCEGSLPARTARHRHNEVEVVELGQRPLTGHTEHHHQRHIRRSADRQDPTDVSPRVEPHAAILPE
jgi:hypothetical protein